MLVRPPGCDMVRPAREAVPADFTLNNLSKNPVNLSIFIEFYRNSISPNAPGRAAIIPGTFARPPTAIAGNCGSDESLDPGGRWLPGALCGGNDSVGKAPAPVHGKDGHGGRDGPLTRTAYYKKRCGFVRHSGESRNPFSSADGTGHAPSFPPRGYRVSASHGNEAAAARAGEKSKWIPAFAGMTVVFLHRGIFSTLPSGAIPLLVLRSPPLCLTLSSAEAAYRRAEIRARRRDILRYGAYAPTQDEGWGRLLRMRESSVLRSPMPRGGSIPISGPCTFPASGDRRDRHGGLSLRLVSNAGFSARLTPCPRSSPMRS